MGSVPVISLLPVFKRFAGIAQFAKQRFIQAFIPQLAVEAFDETVLLGLAQCDVTPIDAGLLNPLEYRHACELTPV